MALFGMLKKSSAGVEYILAGLGNPGEKYSLTRHNAGFLCIDKICGDMGEAPKKLSFHALTCRVRIGGHDTLVMKPQTFMNSSGDAVAEAAAFYKIPPERVIVICDDVSFEPGGMRVRPSGSAGGHNGLKSIIERLGSENFPRIRLGVGKKPEEYDLADWVVASLPKSSASDLAARFDDAFTAVRAIMDGDIGKAQSLNRR